MQKHNLVLAVTSIADWDEPDDTDIKEPYKSTLGDIISQEKRKCRAMAEETAPQSENVMEILPSDSQQRIPGKKSSIVDDLCAIEKGMGMDITSCTPDFGNAVATINEHGSPGNDSQGASKMVGIVCSQERNQEDVNKECSMKCSGAEFSRARNRMPTDSVQTKVEKDMGEQAPELRQDQYQRVEEKKKIHIVQYERDTGQTEISVSHDFEEAEVEPYMRALVDPEEQIHSWLHSTDLQQKEHQKMKGEHQIQITPCERDTRKCQKFLECDLEEVEVEPYMRVLMMNTEEIHSWHESIDYVYPYSEQTGSSTGECVGTSTSHKHAGTFTTDESKNLNTSGDMIEASVNIMPSENRSYSQDKLPQGRHLPHPLAETPEAPCALKEERATLQETSKLCKATSAHSSLEEVKHKQETIKKMISKVQIKKPRLEAKENACNSTSGLKRVSKVELSQKEDKREQWKLPSKKDSKAPKLLKKIQAELFPDFSGNIKLCCQFVEIHEDATITWMKDSQLLARVHRRAGDEFPVSLAIVQAGKKDQGLYCCCLKNTYGKATTDFKLTSEVLEHLSSFQDVEGLEEIEFSELMFREDFICDSYFSNSLHGRITTEELHFGEGVHRKAFRSIVMQGLVPVFSPGHPCVLKVHNAIAYGTKNNDELVKKNYKLALQECYVQNTAREYAKIYAAETKQLEGFGEVPEIIPIFLIHRPKSNIPYATVEEELIGEFVKYSIRDGKEINFMRRDSEAGQKCCTFQHWVYERTSGSLLITDMQGVGMKLTDVGIATLAKGYKGFKGNCSISFIDQFKALHQCNKYCEMLGLKPLQTSYQKQRKPAVPKSKTQQPSSSTVKKTAACAQAAKKT
ncbi:alpha-protein kinase 2 [Eublepharis macularius]|uniref:Alpha-protein kinase 2 n=1 Tax=Eublepharis macularius TaxID=481883 RepID=A0AA97L520_EUBMA|nr:alpha-protein kinase 2 [Eublepharis macularius]